MKKPKKKNARKKAMRKNICPIMSMQSENDVACVSDCALYHPDKKGYACFFQKNAE